MIALQQVSKSYDGALALAETTLRFPPEECVALIGPSGCGKSTLLRLIIGLIQPDSGTITVGEEPVTPQTCRALRLRMGYVIQEGGLFPHLTGADNVALMARHLGWPASRVQARLQELAELTQLPLDLLDRYPVQLSGGQRQRVGLMRALMLDPQVLLMDEPLGALDPLIRAELQEELKRIFQELRKSVVLVTHDLSEAAYLGERIALMRAGRIVQYGPVDELMERPAEPFVTEFVQAQRPRWPEGA